MIYTKEGNPVGYPLSCILSCESLGYLFLSYDVLAHLGDALQKHTYKGYADE